MPDITYSRKEASHLFPPRLSNVQKTIRLPLSGPLLVQFSVLVSAVDPVYNVGNLGKEDQKLYSPD